MSHAPPIPPGNQSPYPIAEPPHVAAPPPPAASAPPTAPPSPVGARALYAGAIIAAGALAGLVYALSKPRAKTAPRKRRRGKRPA